MAQKGKATSMLVSRDGQLLDKQYTGTYNTREINATSFGPTNGWIIYGSRKRGDIFRKTTQMNSYFVHIEGQ